ncbi:hypothetical protein AURANDRAFT_72652, partial [Aureococcus anophagefferens]
YGLRRVVATGGADQAATIHQRERSVAGAHPARLDRRGLPALPGQAPRAATRLQNLPPLRPAPARVARARRGPRRPLPDRLVVLETARRRGAPAAAGAALHLRRPQRRPLRPRPRGLSAEPRAAAPSTRQDQPPRWHRRNPSAGRRAASPSTRRRLDSSCPGPPAKRTSSPSRPRTGPGATSPAARGGGSTCARRAARAARSTRSRATARR